MTAWDPKQEAMRLWGADPCGGDVGDAREGSPEFFRDVDRDRYVSYAPWLPAAAGFDRFAGRRLLEIGCGMGTDLASFARGGAKVHAVDLTPRHLALARQRMITDGRPVRLVRSDGELLPFPDGTFDVVYSFGVLHHTPGTGTAIDEIWRVLKPGGHAVVALYHRNSAFYWFHTILVLGLLHGRLVTSGYRRLVADIEDHNHTDALPLVKVYSRRDLRRLFKRFHSVGIEVHHLEPGHFPYLARLVRRLPDAWFRRASHSLGWYIFAKAVK